MRSKVSLWIIAVALQLITVFFSVAFGEIEHLVITADNILNRVCVDGTDQSPSLTNNKRIPKFDMIPLGESGNWSYVTIEGTNLRHGWAGFLAWETATTPTALAKWQCMPMSDVPGGDCCGVSPSDSGWHPSRDWYRVNGHHNRNYKAKVPSRVTHWFWSSKIKQSHICCISQKCDEVCAKCMLPGISNCLECMFGSTDVNVTDPTSGTVTTVPNRCKYKCYVDVSASPTGPKTVTKITNAASGNTVTLDSNRLQIMFWVDVTTCQPSEVTYGDTANDANAMTTFFRWNADPSYTNFVVVRLFSALDIGSGPTSIIRVVTLTGTGGTVATHVNNEFTNVKFWINTFPNVNPGLQDSDFSDRTPSDKPLQ